MTEHPEWIQELIDARIAENLEREALTQIEQELRTLDAAQ